MMASATGSLQRLAQHKQESTESYKDLSVSADDEEKQPIPKELLLDLSFLTDQERRTLIKVIKADQEFKKATLETMKQSVERERQYQELQKSTAEGKHEKCTCCGLVLKTICSRTFATKCSNCGHLVCKNCRKGDAKTNTCLVCIKEKLVDLQTVDYMPVLNRIEEEQTSDVSAAVSHCVYGSELLKESLAQESAAPAIERPKVMITKDKARTPEPLPLFSRVEKQKRSKSLEPSASLDSKQSTMDSSNQGFKVIRQGRSEEDLDDLCSLYSEPDYNSDVIGGKLKLGIWYRMDDKTLYVRISKAKDLTNIGESKPDPYVRMHLLPDKTKLTKRRTSIQRKTNTPDFDELLKYGRLERSDLSTKILWVTVWSWDRHGRNKFLGEVRLSLTSLDLTNTSDVWYNLQEYMDESDIEDVDIDGSKGKLLLALKYDFHQSNKVASLQRNISTTMVDLHILVKKAEGLPAMEPSGSTNSFVRTYLLPNKLMASKKKTGVVSKSLDPEWNEKLVYTVVPLDELETSRVLEVTLWDHDRRGINAFIGGLRIGPDPIVAGNPELWMDSSAEESSHWEAMLSRQGEWVEQWHTLRPSMEARQMIKMRRKTSISEVNVNISLSSISTNASGSAGAEETSEKLSTLDETVPMSPAPATLGDEATPTSVTASVDIKKSKKTPQQQAPPSISITRGARGDYKITGEVLVGIEYQNEQLQVHINRAIKLAAVGKGGTSNPYIKIYLLPDASKKSKLKTSIKKKTIDPIFNETLQYKIGLEDVTSRAMWLTVWSAARIGNQFLGEACIPLGSLDLTDPGQRWYQLHDFTETGVVLPPNLTSAPSTQGSSSGRRSPVQHRTRANAFSRSSTPVSRQDSTKSIDKEFGSQSPVPVPSSQGKLVPKSMPPRQASADSDGGRQFLVIAQGEKRGSEDSIIPLIKIEDQDTADS